MNLKKAKIEGKLCDVITLEDLHKNPEMYQTGNIGIEVEGFVLPYKPTIQSSIPSDQNPGVYPLGNVGELIFYPKTNQSAYQPQLIDFSDTKTIENYLSKQGQLKNIEKEILTTQDNIFKPPIGENDTPEMRALKTAIARKNIDIDKYQSRFGENFPNDKRKMKDEKISLLLLKRIGEALDMNIQIKISDTNPNVPNPMGNPVIINVTTPQDTEEE